MKSIIDSLDNIRFDHSIWLSEILYTIQEIKLYENQITKIMKNYSGKEEQKALGVMLKEFDVEKQTLIHIKNTIQSHIEHINIKVQANGEIKALSDNNHQKSREMMDYFRKSYSDLKDKYHRYATVKF